MEGFAIKSAYMQALHDQEQGVGGCEARKDTESLRVFIQLR